jgi:2-phosphoglycerate kinase
VIYLIGGPPKVGKSTVAKYLRKKRSVQSISTDAIRALMFQITEPSLRASLLPCCIPVAEIGKQFEQTVYDWVQNQLKEAQTLLQPAAALINYHIRIREDLVLEGVHVVPSLVEEILKSNSASEIRVILISAGDNAIVRNNLYCETEGFNWLTSLNQKTLEKIAECIVSYSTILERQSQKLAITTYQRSTDFDKDVVEILSLLTD